MTVDDLRARHPEHFRTATALRALALDGVKAANSGHSGMPIGMADVATVLYSKHLRFSAAHPDWADRDRFILSAGHGSMLLYGLLYLTGTAGWSLDDLKAFRQLGAKTAGHPEYGHAPGIETTTGPLGQGIANAVGFAIAEEALRARFGKKIIDHKTWVIAGDGCLMEGVSQEAITLAGRQRLSNLIVLWDDNGITIDGKVDIADRTDQIERFRSAGWAVFGCDGHNPTDIDRALGEAKASPLPAFVACKTHIGLGTSAQDTSKAHGALTDDALIAAARETWDWPHAPFEIPADVKATWQAIGQRGDADWAAWTTRLDALSGARKTEFARSMAGQPPKKLTSTIRALKKSISEAAPRIATRKASENALAVLNPILPESIGGSADLTGSNNTLTKDMGVFDIESRGGRYIYYGIREHGMAAAMNGMALHGGVLPYGGTFMVFTDYARPAIRLSALMGQRVVYVMTHDSIGLGEDGPTHQPVEHLAALRAIPGLTVLRPADAVETAESWELAVQANGPTVLALTRQNLPTLRTDHKTNNLSAQGAYVLAEAQGKRRAILIATGSEVEIAMAAKALLEAEGIGTRVVSMPSMELFAQQDEAYRRRVLPAGPVRVAVEAAIRQGWDQWLCAERGAWKKAGFIGMSSFGASAPYEDLYTHFGITAEAVAAEVKGLL